MHDDATRPQGASAAAWPRRERTRVLVEGDPALRRAFADEIRAAYATEEPPATRGLAMIDLRETAQRTRFLMGEVLIQEATARVAGTLGRGLIRGDDPAAATDLAVVDAALRAGLPETASWAARLRAEDARLAARRAAEAAVLRRTKVRFDVMQEEDPT
ncbi:MAG: phosphonate C-P lyase system protein PhnG [Trueperaceae bacterium]|nr:phosphonate C-P lyase system protein PhnG [Trueperaceae bacterium]